MNLLTQLDVPDDNLSEEPPTQSYARQLYAHKLRSSPCLAVSIREAEEKKRGEEAQLGWQDDEALETRHLCTGGSWRARGKKRKERDWASE